MVGLLCAATTIVVRIATHGPDAPARTALADCADKPAGPAMRRCYTSRMLFEVRDVRAPTAVLARIDRDVNRIGDYPASNCHVLMHTVGRRYAKLRKVTLATLMEYLPRNNDPGCAAGFAHGVITQIAPQVLRAGPAASQELCGRATTRFLRYSCTHGLGHAYMRYYAESLQPSLRLCRALGSNAAPDCAQGAYHDYWLAVAGRDETKRPVGATTDVRALCGGQPHAFVLGCWYRAFIESRPAGYQTKSAADLRHICADTTGLQREGCVTAASVIGSPNPLRQMRVCSQLPERDVLPCVHGVKVQNLIGTPASNQLRVIARCSWLNGPVATGCYEWLGKVLSVITDGRFEKTGCPHVEQPQPCLRGARSYEGPLVTFS